MYLPYSWYEGLEYSNGIHKLAIYCHLTGVNVHELPTYLAVSCALEI